MTRAAMILAWLAASGAVVANLIAADPDRLGEDAALQQLLVRTILAQKPALHGHSADTFCVVVGSMTWKNDLLVPPDGPSEAFLSAVATQGMTVLPGRACQMISMGVDRPGVVVRDTSKPAFFVTVSDVKRPTASTAEAHAGFICGAMCASGMTYKLQLRQGKWSIVGTRDHVVS